MNAKGTKSYKDDYHFRELPSTSRLDDFPSLFEDNPRINSSIKKNTERANVEIEKDEIVLQPDMSALFKANGKKHSGGGIDVMLRPNSFIFSDDKSLKITKDENDLFEFKKGGKFKDTTPANVVKKNVDMEHYNRLVSILSDPKKDDLSKRSSALMLDKYTKTLGQVAYLQEMKKNFPDGIPPFAEGTAPVKDPELQSEIDENKQYAKYGGKILPKAQLGDQVGVGPDYPYHPITNPTGYKSQLNIFNKPKAKPTAYDLAYESLRVKDKPLQVVQGPETPRLSQQGFPMPKQNKLSSSLYDALIGNATTKAEVAKAKAANNPYPDITTPFEFNSKWYVRTNGKLVPVATPIKQAMNQYKLNPASAYGTTTANTTQPPAVSSATKSSSDDNVGTSGVKPLLGVPPRRPTGLTPAGRPIVKITPSTPEEYPITENPTPPEIEGGDGTVRADWEFTPYQKESQAYNLFKALNVKRYMPYRSHMNASYLDPALVNPEQAIGDMQNAYNQNIRAAENLNPILRNAQNQDSYGQLLDKMPGVRSQYDNQNAGILNNARQNNNQIKNNETQTNLGFDQKYYQEEVTGRANYDNMKNYLGDQYMNNRMRDVETNQSLAYNLLTQDDPAYNFDWKNTKFTRTKKSILDAKTNKLDDSYKELFDVINRVHDPAVRARLMVDAYKQKHILPYLKGVSE